MLLSAIQMEEIENRLCRILIDILEARLAASEIERVGWTRVINSPGTTLEERAAAIAQRDAALVEWGSILTELEELRHAFVRQ